MTEQRAEILQPASVVANVDPRASMSWLQRLAPGRGIGVLALILLLSFLTLYPFAMLLYGSLHSTPPGMAGTFNLDGYANLASAENLRALINTVALSLVKTVLSLSLAILLA